MFVPLKTQAHKTKQILPLHFVDPLSICILGLFFSVICSVGYFARSAILIWQNGEEVEHKKT